MDSHIVIHFASDTVDASILLLAQIATVLASFSFAVSILFLFDYIKRHGWQYKHRKKIELLPDDTVTMPTYKIESDHTKVKRGRKIKKNPGSPF